MVSYTFLKYLCTSYSSRKWSVHLKCWNILFGYRNFLMLRVNLMYLHISIVLQCQKFNLHFIEHHFDCDAIRQHDILFVFCVTVRLLPRYGTYENDPFFILKLHICIIDSHPCFRDWFSFCRFHLKRIVYRQYFGPYCIISLLDKLCGSTCVGPLERLYTGGVSPYA